MCTANEQHMTTIIFNHKDCGMQSDSLLHASTDSNQFRIDVTIAACTLVEVAHRDRRRLRRHGHDHHRRHGRHDAPY